LNTTNCINIAFVHIYLTHDLLDVNWAVCMYICVHVSMYAYMHLNIHAYYIRTSQMCLWVLIT